jgi:hypothetical protein
VSSILSGAERVSLIEKWRVRHALPDAIGMWAISTGAEARALAVNAIAQDPRVLQRADRLQAIKMAAQAEDFAVSLADTAGTSSDTWRAVTLFVRQAIAVWRRSLKAYDRRPDSAVGSSALPTLARHNLSSPWEIAWRNFPYVDDQTGRLATRVLHEYGPAMLRRMQEPWDQVIVLAVVRYAARVLRGEAKECERDNAGGNAVTDILTIQSYALRNGLSPMHVGYTGPGRPIEQALGLLRDARTLRDAAAKEGGEERADIWQRAVDFHAYAVVALNHRILLDLPLDEAYEIAGAAIRQAEAAVRSPDQALLPDLPRGTASTPDVVRLHARACLPPSDAGAVQEPTVPPP